MRKDFFEVARYASDKGLHVSVATNGTLLTNSVVERLERSGIAYVEVSLDGSDKETHESFRSVEGCFDKAIAGIRNSVEAGMFTCIATTATRHNIGQVPKIVALAKRLGVKRVIVFNFIPTGRGEDIVSLDLSPVQREILLEDLYEELTRGQIEVLCTAPQYSRVCV
jgi:MoaA/NifB/PqqE/SkfB family radical SAM enzyme